MNPSEENPGKQSQQGEQDSGSRYDSMPISWQRDREELNKRIGDLVDWRRENGFPRETDDELVHGVLNVIEAQRVRNIRMYHQLITEAVNQGEDAQGAAMEILRAWMRNAAREIRAIEDAADAEREGHAGEG